MSAVIEIQDMTLVLGGRKILDVPTFSLESGESVSLMGPNGAGKSSLLFVMALLQDPTSGKLKYFGKSLEEHPRLELQRRMAMVFQKPMLLDLNVVENVDLGLKFRGINRKERTRRIMDSLEQMEVAHLAHRRARSLSGGEAQRVAIARAVARRPALILADEPTGNLDADNAVNILQLLASFKDKDTTVIVTTHATHLMEHQKDATVVHVDKGNITVERRGM